MNIAAIDMGNSRYDAIINGREHNMPNALAVCETHPGYYDASQQSFFDNMVVEVSSKAVKNLHGKYFVGISATEKENVSRTEKNNQKATSDRNTILFLSLLAFDAARLNLHKDSIDIQYDFVSTALPTSQVKQDRELLREKLVGYHTVTFYYVPGKEKPVTVNINIKNAMVGIEGAVVHVALTRDPETLKIKDETLANETVIIGDLGGDSFDPAGIRDKKIVDGIEGYNFGVNSYLDAIISAVANHTKFQFPSRYSLEKRLEKGPAHWQVVINQEDVDITQYVEPQLRMMAEKLVTDFAEVRKHVALQEAKRYFLVGGAVKLAKKYVEEANNNLPKPMKLTIPDNAEKLTSLGLWILVQAAAKKAAKEQAAATKE
ncbi:ParM/StbA family protein [Aneurinibacillus aneurinilyticus]|uniref:ParM/StbA family protein n=1 Tax=Aneurinibacillus aneurinilyticus TaxID=1391 RepID=UPI0023F32F58|nr:ParM/StbA family protein [Aneurinibacillus aneurinilyticus]